MREQPASYSVQSVFQTHHQDRPVRCILHRPTDTDSLEVKLRVLHAEAELARLLLEIPGSSGYNWKTLS
jgi:hypothetical protein